MSNWKQYRGPSVSIRTEDRTGGGLERLLIAAAQATRARRGQPPLRYEGGEWASAKNNHQLLESCRKYLLLRKQGGYDHVFFVIDLKEVHTIVGEKPIRPNNHQDKERVQKAVIDRMTQYAQSKIDSARWDEYKSGFHPFVLEWERESVLIRCTDGLGLGDPHPDPDNCSTAADWLARRFKEFRRRKYEKGTDGRLLFDQLINLNYSRLSVR